MIDSDFTFLNSRLGRFYEIFRVKNGDLESSELVPKAWDPGRECLAPSASWILP